MNTRRLSAICLALAMLLSACGRQSEKVVEELIVAATPQAVSSEKWKVAPTIAVAEYPPPYEGGEAALGYAAPLAASSATERMVIKNAEMELLVQNTQSAMSQATQLAVEYGGYVLSSESWYSDEVQYASLRLAIPAANFEQALNALRQLGVQTLKENVYGQDVSAEYTDLRSRLTSLEATAARVRQFLDDAKTVEDALRVNATLSDLETQIERVKGQMKYYESLAAFSTITLSLSPYYPKPTSTPTPTPTPVPAWNPGQTFGQASQVLVTSAQSLVDVIIWITVVAGPYALALAGLYGLVRLLIRRHKREKPPS